MKVWNFLVFVSLISAALASDITELTETNFDKFMRDNPYVLVEFYASWCEHCKNFAPVFEGLAKKNKELNLPFVFAKIDANEYYRIRDKYHIESFPTLKAFVNAIPSSFKFDFTGSEILDFLRRKSKPFPIELKTKEQVQEIIYGRGLRSILIANDKNVIKEYEESSIESSTKNKFYRTSEEIGKQLFPEAQPFPSTVLFKDYDEKKVIFRPVLGKYNLAKTLTDSIIPNISPFGKRINELYIGEGARRTGIVLLWNKEKDQAAYKSFEKLRERIPSKDFVFVHTNYHPLEEKAIKLAFDIKENELPALVIASMDGAAMRRYIYKGPMTVDDMYNFWQKWRDNEAPRHYKSEEPFTNQVGPVYKVAGKSWNDVVVKHPSDVVVYFYEEDCADCKILNPIYEEVAQMYPTIKFVKINGHLNEIPGRAVAGYPTVILLKKDFKDNALLLDKSDKKGLIDSIKAKSGANPIEVPVKQKTDL